MVERQNSFSVKFKPLHSEVVFFSLLSVRDSEEKKIIVYLNQKKYRENYWKILFNPFNYISFRLFH